MSVPPSSPRSPLREDLRREIVEAHKILKAQEKYERYCEQNVQHLAGEVAQNVQNPDLTTRLNLAMRTQSAFRNSNIKAALKNQVRNAAVDYTVISRGDDMQKLARARYPDDAEKQKAFLQEIQPELPNLSGQGADITELLRALGFARDSFSATFSSFSSNSTPK